MSGGSPAPETPDEEVLSDALDMIQAGFMASGREVARILVCVDLGVDGHPSDFEGVLAHRVCRDDAPPDALLMLLDHAVQVGAQTGRRLSFMPIGTPHGQG